MLNKTRSSEQYCNTIRGIKELFQGLRTNNAIVAPSPWIILILYSILLYNDNKVQKYIPVGDSHLSDIINQIGILIFQDMVIAIQYLFICRPFDWFRR